jgi:hypothetical protein
MIERLEFIRTLKPKKYPSASTYIRRLHAFQPPGGDTVKTIGVNGDSSTISIMVCRNYLDLELNNFISPQTGSERKRRNNDRVN